MLGGWGRLSQGLSGTLALRPGPHAALRGAPHPGLQQCGLVTTRGRQKATQRRWGSWEPGAPFTDKETGSERPCNSLKPHSRLAGDWPHLQVILGPLGELECIRDL